MRRFDAERGAQEHRVDECEHGRVRADAERDEQRRGERIQWMSRQRAERIARFVREHLETPFLPQLREGVWQRTERESDAAPPGRPLPVNGKLAVPFGAPLAAAAGRYEPRRYAHEPARD